MTQQIAVKIQEIINKGKIINKCLIDVDEHNEIKSNGSQEFYYKYKGHIYTIWMDLNNNPLDNLSNYINPCECYYNE